MDRTENFEHSCVDCGALNCSAMNRSYPDFCLTGENANEEAMAEALSLYEKDENHRIMLAAADVECDYYCKMTRVEELMEFARAMGYQKLGVATCAGLIREARILTRILRAGGFTVFGVVCKAGAVKKTRVGIDPRCEKVGVNMCNPIYQAKRLAAEHTELNIVVGLCVGHDILFNKYSEAPVTTLVVKDRVLGHNPAAALYTAESFYKRLLEES